MGKLVGTARMSPEQRREVASKGGRACQATGRAHHWSSEEAKIAGRLGARASLEKRKCARCGKPISMRKDIRKRLCADGEPCQT